MLDHKETQVNAVSALSTLLHLLDYEDSLKCTLHDCFYMSYAHFNKLF